MLRIHHQKVTSAKMIAVGSDKLCHRASVGGLTRTKQTRSQAFVGYLLDHLHEVSHSYQVVDCQREGKHPADPQEPPMPGLTHQPNGLQPPEDLLHPFALCLAERVSGMSGRTAIQSTVLL